MKEIKDDVLVSELFLSVITFLRNDILVNEFILLFPFSNVT